MVHALTKITFCWSVPTETTYCFCRTHIGSDIIGYSHGPKQKCSPSKVWLLSEVLTFSFSRSKNVLIILKLASALVLYIVIEFAVCEWMCPSLDCFGLWWPIKGALKIDLSNAAFSPQYIYCKKKGANQRLTHLLRGEEIKWYKRSKAKFLLEGDRNTRFYHLIVNSKLRRQNFSARTRGGDNSWKCTIKEVYH